LISVAFAKKILLYQIMTRFLQVAIFSRSPDLSLLVIFSLSTLFTGYDAFAKKAHQESVSSIQAKAIQGDSYYQGLLSLYYKYGSNGLSIDMDEAERWAKNATKNGGGIGMATLASIHFEKGKTDRSQFLYDEAYLHSNLRELAKSKDPFALFCIGLMEMDNPPRNPQKGFRNIQTSAKIGLPIAQATLGVIYLTGSGVERDLNEGVKWCSLGAKKTIPLAMYYLGLAYSFGDGVTKNQDYASRWIRAAADRGLASAQYTLGMRLGMGDGMEKNLKLGALWLRKAAKNGSEDANVQLRRFETLLNSNREISKTFHSLEDMDVPKSKTGETSTKVSREIGLKNYNNKNYKQAKIHFLRASEHNDAVSQRYLGVMYFLGQGCKKDNQLARAWLNKAAKLGDPDSLRYLKVMQRISD
jgi:TPR repeat protein